MSAVNQKELYENLTNRLLLTLPAGWEYSQVQYRVVGDHEEVSAIVHSVTGQLLPWTPPEQLVADFRVLRDSAASPKTGAWVSARLTIQFPNKAKLDFNSSEQPQWRIEPSQDDFQVELARYPREEDYIPAWFPLRRP